MSADADTSPLHTEDEVDPGIVTGGGSKALGDIQPSSDLSNARLILFAMGQIVAWAANVSSTVIRLMKVCWRPGNRFRPS
jgi:hypothetical protein